MIKGMKVNISMESNNFVSIKDWGENNVMQSVSTNYEFAIQKDEKVMSHYRDDAKRLLNQLSKNFNAMGIHSLMAMLIHETLVKGNYGKENP